MTHMINIQPRKPRFDLSDVPVFWNDGDPVLTRFFDALSIHFPDGERFLFSRCVTIRIWSQILN
jgi:predicted metal-dependent hydrolase